MDLQLTGKTALVTASSRGLGRASALALAQEGADLVIAARSAQIDEAAAAIRDQTGSRVTAVRADVTRQEDVARLVQTALDAYGRLDVLVVNAGGPPVGKFLDFTPADWEKAVNLTLMSAVRLCYAAVPPMLKQGGGSIVAIESVSVKQPVDNLILSNSVRMAVIGMLKTMANELGPQGIRINSINPTFTYTDRVRHLLASRAQANGATEAEEAAKIAQTIPLRRMGTAEEFGRVVAWLASPAAAFIHGHALMFDGGATRSAL